jgi:hypothetical protein
LHHPVICGMETREFATLLADVEQYILDHPPISLHHKRARHAPCGAARSRCPTGCWQP